jgi:probable rRNA maturation factor
MLMALLVDIQVAPQYEPLVNSGRLRQAVASTIEHQGWQEDAEIVLVVTDDAGIRELNREFRDIDAPTDVLSFPDTLAEDFVTPEGYSGYLGDVIISYPRAEVQAQEAGHSPLREMELLTVHGVLHLMGLDDVDEAGWREMTEIQDEIMASLSSEPSSAEPTPPAGASTAERG